MSARRSSSVSSSIFATSWDVRKPSKKCRNGMRVSSVAACATAAMSCASWTEFEHRSANPVWRQAITSWWSPKIDSAWVASVRAATCITNGVSSPAILYMLGIMSSRPCDAVNVVASEPGLQRAVHRAGGPGFRLHLGDLRDRAPEVRHLPARPFVAELGHVAARRDRIDGDRLARPVGNRRGCFVSVYGDSPPARHVSSDTGQNAFRASPSSSPV